MILTDEQMAIIRHALNSHAKVLSVAGSGKTTTMVERIDHLVR
jgi:DNA helicase-2/ATP-dependent DNA helicase PcrA